MAESDLDIFVRTHGKEGVRIPVGSITFEELTSQARELAAGFDARGDQIAGLDKILEDLRGREDRLFEALERRDEDFAKAYKSFNRVTATLAGMLLLSCLALGAAAWAINELQPVSRDVPVYIQPNPDNSTR